MQPNTGADIKIPQSFATAEIESTKPPRRQTLDNLSQVWNIINEFLATGRLTTTMGGHVNVTNGQSVVTEEFDLSYEQCAYTESLFFTTSQAWVRGLTGSLSDNRSVPLTSCNWTLRVPAGHHLSAVMRLENDFCKRLTTTGEAVLILTSLQDECLLPCSRRSVLMSTSSQLSFSIQVPTRGEPPLSPRFQILFLATRHSLRSELQVVSTSSSSGYMTTPGYSLAPLPAFMEASHELHPPDGFSSVFLSFHRLDVLKQDVFTVSVLDKHGAQKHVWTNRDLDNIPFSVYNESVYMYIQTSQGLCEGSTYQSQTFRVNTSPRHCEGFKALFSFHVGHEIPPRLNSGRVNCSVSFYATFKQHVDCNLDHECESGEDEGAHCPFSNDACGGDVAVGHDKCYRLHVSDTQLSWRDAQKVCQDREGQLAVINTRQEKEVFLSLLLVAKTRVPFYVGLTIYRTGLPMLYARMWTWVDDRAYYTLRQGRKKECDVYMKKMPEDNEFGAYYNLASIFEGDESLNNPIPSEPLLVSFLCEHRQLNMDEAGQNSTNSRYNNRFQLPVYIGMSDNTSKRRQPSSLTSCPQGHWTHDFLACDWEAVCQVTYFTSQCPLVIATTNVTEPSHDSSDQAEQVSEVAMFVCDDLAQTLPYTLVCNFASDCMDKTDETFCRHPWTRCERPDFLCDSGQCVRSMQGDTSIICDLVNDCYDQSDEYESQGCFYHLRLEFNLQPVNLPASIDFSYSYRVVVRTLGNETQCPETHFNCSELSFCLPVYMRCNDMYDCPHQEDELHCDSYTCPGFYRCRGSAVCVHLTHLCDGVVQCALRDDEMLCGSSCPPQCHCQGLAFVCDRPFFADRFPGIRYLDGSHSLLTCAHLTNNSYLVFLRLSSCNILSLTDCRFANLQALDLSNNMIDVLSTAFGQFLPNLKEIHLSKNRIHVIAHSNDVVGKSVLAKLDLSFNAPLDFFDCALLRDVQSIVHLNVSHNSNLRLGDQGFTCFPLLREIDMRGIHSEMIDSSVYAALKHIEILYLDDYRQCCSHSLPKVEHDLLCMAPSPGVASCSDVLHSSVHRLCLWFLVLLFCIGNLWFLTEKCVGGIKQQSINVEVFASHLYVCDCVMGLYLCIVVAAQSRFHGDFVLHEKEWLSSFTCKVAGFVVFVSCEASCLIVCLIAVDRVLALYVCSVKFSVRSVWLTCLVSWVLAVTVATVPWLPGLSLWNAHSITAICLPIPVLTNRSRLQTYSFGLLVVFNSTLTLATAFCQILVYIHVRSNYVIASDCQSSQDMLMAQRVMALVVSNVVCHLSVGVVSIINTAGAAAVDINALTSLVFLILPLAPTLTPLLYGLSSLKERLKLKTEAKLMLTFEAKLRSQIKTSCPAKRTDANTVEVPQAFRSADHVVQFLEQCLQTGRLNVQDVERVLGCHENNILFLN